MIGNNLLITGSSRFLNPINGSCTNGTTVTTQTQSTKFMREDGTWSAPSYTAATTDKYHTTGTWSSLTYTATANGGAGALAFTIPTGTTASTVCVGNDSRLSDARTPTSHTHGNIQNGGTLQTNDITIASGDKLVVTDSSDSSKVARTSISFDGSTATQCLTKKGTWETFGTSNLTIGTTSTTAMAGNTNVNNVTQTATTTDAEYELLFSGTADNTTRTEGVRKNNTLKCNPSNGSMSLNKIKIGSINSHIDESNSSRLRLGVNYPTSTNGSANIELTDSSDTDYPNSCIIKVSDATYSHTLGILPNGKLHFSGDIQTSQNFVLDHSSSDIVFTNLSGNTWDGTNTSLKTAITTLADRNWYTYVELTDKNNVAANTVTNVGTWKPTVGGVYLIQYVARFSANASGYRKIYIASSATASDGLDRFARVSVQACNGDHTYIELVAIETLTANTTYYFNAIHNASAAVNISYPGLKIMRIR